MTAAFRSGERTLPLPEFRRRAAQAASGFAALGVGRGDTVAVFLRNDFPLLEAASGAGLLGAYVVPVNWHASADEARYIFEDSAAKVVVIHADLLPGVAAAIPDGVQVLVAPTPPEIAAAYGLDAEAAAPAPDAQVWEDWLSDFDAYDGAPVPSPGSMIYTSGTTGRPKGVRRAPRTPEQELEGRAGTHAIFGITGWEDRLEDIVLLIPGPLYHSAPNGWAMYFANAGASIVLEPRFDPEGLLRDIERHKVTHLLAVPTMFVRLLKLPAEVRARYDLSSLKFVMHGAAPCPPHVKREMISWWGPIIWEHYGNTEVGGLTICDSQEWLAHPGTVGKVMEGCEVRLLGPDGEEVPQGQSGEIVGWRWSYADFTYHGDDQKRAKAQRADGLVATGDVGFFDADGFLHLAGRATDMVISGGVNIYPAEIEAELLRMPGVRDVAVFGVPDEEFGEALCTYIQPDEGVTLTEGEVKSFVRSRLAGYKTPRLVEFRDELPREDSGKIFKRKLREPYWAAAGRQI